MEQQPNNNGNLILSVDIGTSLIKCNVYDRRALVRGTSSWRLETINVDPGGVEVEPEHLWLQVTGAIKEAIEDCGCGPSEIRALGLCTQRGTFTTWDKETGEHFHNFISWKDTRCSELCDQWNKSWTIKGLNYGSKVVHSVTKSKRYLAGSIYNLKSRMIAPRLLWAIENYPKLKSSLNDNRVLFGGIDTWLLWKMTKGQVVATEISLASATGMFDPFIQDWGYSILKSITIPVEVLPRVCDTGHIFGHCHKDLFGFEIPIAALSGDQQAGTFGCCCFDVGSVKLTLGTGMFIDMNTGRKAHSSIYGIYPLVGWKLQDDLVYLVESSANDAGSVLSWAHSIGLFDNFDDLSTISVVCSDTAGVYFVPAFSGLQAPINNNQACAMFVGLKASTTKDHMVRSILLSLTFSVYQIYEVMLQETGFSPPIIKCTGGVSKNEFLCQHIADITNVPLQRMDKEESTSLGVAFIAGLVTRFWESKQEVESLIRPGKMYTPRPEKRIALLSEYLRWKKAVQRSLNWYT